MNKIERGLVTVGTLLFALAALLSAAHGNVTHCIALANGGCQEVGFAYGATGKLALLLGFVLFLSAALHGIFRGASARAH